MVGMQECQSGIHPEKAKHFIASYIRSFQPGQGLHLIAEPSKDYGKSVRSNILLPRNVAFLLKAARLSSFPRPAHVHVRGGLGTQGYGWMLTATKRWRRTSSAL